MKKIINKKNKGVYIIFAFVSIIFFYISINVLYTQTSSVYDEELINNLPNAERFVKNIKTYISETNRNVVIIEWEGIKDDNVIYYLYRSTNPIIGKSSFVDSSVIDYIKATNDSKYYFISDRPLLSSKYYYAVVSYIDDLSFYSAKENTDTSSIVFNGISYDSNNNIVYNNNQNNIEYTNKTSYDNIKYDSNNNSIRYDTNKNITNISSVTNTYFLTNVYHITNTYSLTNIYSVTNTYSLTNTYSVTNKYNAENKAAAYNSKSQANTAKNTDKYRNDYNKALSEFTKRNYSSAAKILEPISNTNINKELYYDINLLLGKCYKYLGRKKNALNIFNKIKTYNSQEVNFWINQVLSDL